jgi:CHAD domain-containing protein
VTAAGSLELVVGEGTSLEALQTALAGELRFGTVDTQVVERTYYDTFDALLRDAGLTLWLQDGRLELTGEGGAALHGEALPSEQVQPLTRVIPGHALPNGPLREAVLSEIDARALLPQARVRLRIATAPLLDELDKTVVRLSLLQPELVPNVPSGRPLPLAARLELRGLRGYESSLRRAWELLRETLAVEAPERSLRDGAVLASGGVPEGVSVKLKVPLSAAQRTDVAAAQVLRALLAVMEANLPGMLADLDSEFLHDYRVSLRKARSVLRELRGAFEPESVAAVRTELKWLQQATGGARDLDVYVRDFEQLRGLVPEPVQTQLEPLLRVLEIRRGAAHRQLVRDLRGDRAGAALAAWTELLDGVTNAGDDAARPIVEVSSKRIRKVYRRMLRMGDAIIAGGPGTPPDDYHELRKQGKELRYLLELFGAPLHDESVVKPMVKSLKRLQDVLGHHQDREVQLTMIGELADEVSMRPGGAGALMAMGILVERLEADAETARDEFAEVFAAFASDKQRQLVKEAFS